MAIYFGHDLSVLLFKVGPAQNPCKLIGQSCKSSTHYYLLPPIPPLILQRRLLNLFSLIPVQHLPRSFCIRVERPLLLLLRQGSDFLARLFAIPNKSNGPAQVSEDLSDGETRVLRYHNAVIIHHGETHGAEAVNHLDPHGSERPFTLGRVQWVGSIDGDGLTADGGNLVSNAQDGHVLQQMHIGNVRRPEATWLGGANGAQAEAKDLVHRCHGIGSALDETEEMEARRIHLPVVVEILPPIIGLRSVSMGGMELDGAGDHAGKLTLLAVALGLVPLSLAVEKDYAVIWFVVGVVGLIVGKLGLDCEEGLSGEDWL